MTSTRLPARSRLALGLGTVVLVLLLWEAASRLGLVSLLVLPPPTAVWQRGLALLGDSYQGTTLLGHAASSLRIVMGAWGLAILIGIPLGVTLGWWPRTRRWIGTYVEMIRPIPPVAWIPLALIWFGLSPSGKVFVVWLAAVVPCILNTQAAVVGVRQSLIDGARVLGAPTSTIITRVALPTASPLILTGIRLALGNAWMTLVAAELLASTAGLGYMMQAGRRNQDSAVIIVGMVVIGLLGALTSMAVQAAERRAFPWAAEERH